MVTDMQRDMGGKIEYHSILWLKGKSSPELP